MRICVNASEGENARIRRSWEVEKGRVCVSVVKQTGGGKRGNCNIHRPVNILTDAGVRKIR